VTSQLQLINIIIIINTPFRRFRASAAKWIRTALLWTITQRLVKIPYGRFGTAYRYHLQRPRIWNRGMISEYCTNVWRVCVCEWVSVCALFTGRCTGDKIEDDEMDKACGPSRHGRERKKHASFMVGNIKERRNLGGTWCRWWNNNAKMYVTDKNSLCLLYSYG
jgi:hypothetical protein